MHGVRSAAHEDINLITLLISSGEPGLEILRRDGAGSPSTSGPDAVVVNVGDMLQRLTNHVFVSTTHRVINPAALGRALPLLDAVLPPPEPRVLDRTLPGCISPEQPNRYPEPILAHAYLEQRLREIGLL